MVLSTVVIVLWAASCGVSRFGESEGGAGIWFDALDERLELSAEDGRALARFTAAALLPSGAAKAAPFPDGLSADRKPRIAFVSVASGPGEARVAMGRGRGIRRAVEMAIERAKEDVSPSRPVRHGKIDVVSTVYAVEKVRMAQPIAKGTGVHGFAFAGDSGLAFLPDEVLAHELAGESGALRADRLLTYIQTRGRDRSAFLEILKLREFPLFVFDTASFYFDDRRVVPFYRANPVIGEVDRAELLEAARLAGDYLVRSVSETGRFDYIYWPPANETRPTYNMLRHAGTAYSMVELYEVTRDERLLAAARRALRYLVNQTRPCSFAGKSYECVVDGPSIKLGGNALAAIALSKYQQVTGDEQYRSRLRPLMRWIQATQGADGEFTIHKQRHVDGRVSDFRSAYYPGETLLALCRVYALEGDESLLDTAERGAQWLINVRDAGKSIEKLDHDHWLLYALNELYRHRPNPIYFDHAMKIATAIVNGQNREDSPPDWTGSYYRPPRSTPTAIRTEGLCAAYRLALDHDRPDDAARMLRAIRAGIAFQLQTQFGPESVLYLNHPERALGGFKASLTSPEIRIDYVQHNISALLGLHAIEGSL